MKLNWIIPLFAAAGLALAGCGGGGSSSTAATPPQEQPQPTPYEVATAAIAAADTAAAAQAAVDAAVAAGITGAQLQSLNMAVAERTAAIAAAAAAEQRQMLVAAAACTDATAACVAAHDALIAALQADVDELAADETATNAQQTAAQMALETAQEARDEVVMALAEIDRSTATGMAVGNAVDAANGLEDARDADDIANAEMLLATAKGMLTDADDYATQIEAAEMAIARAKERNMVDAAVMAAETAATGLADDSSVDAVTDAQGVIDAANTAIEGAEHLTDAEKAAQTDKVTAAQRTVTVAKNANDEVARLAAAAAKVKMEGLFAAVKQEVTGSPAYTGEEVVEVTVPKGVPTVKLAATGNTITATTKAVTLADSRLYTVQEGPEPVLFTKHYESRLSAPSDVLTLDDAQMDGKYAKAGDFPLNGGTATYTDTTTTDDALPNTISIDGTLMGATGTFLCGDETAGADCTISEDKGVFSFGTGWTFDADDKQMVMVEDTDYTQYGWWAYKRKDGTYRVGTFYGHSSGTTTHASDVATAPGAIGAATYTGSAAGKYAIDNRPTGDVLDAGHFTADATIVADLDATTTTVSGTINNFMTGETERDWSVALGKTAITWAAGDDFATTAPDGTADAADAATGTVAGGAANVWSINGVKAAADGDWQGGFYHDGTPRLDDTPSDVVGSFSASHGSNAFMVGAFGAANEADDRPQ